MEEEEDEQEDDKSICAFKDCYDTSVRVCLWVVHPGSTYKEGKCAFYFLIIIVCSRNLCSLLGLGEEGEETEYVQM